MNISSILSNNTIELPSNHMQSNFLEASRFFKDYKYDTSPDISEKSLREILKLSIRHTAQEEEKETNSRNQNSSFNFIGRWQYHMLNLEELEIRFRNSHEYTSEKAIEIFQSHFEELKKYAFHDSFDVNIKLFSNAVGGEYYLTPIGYAYSRRMPTLIHALIKSGANKDCGFITSKNVPLFLKEISPLSLMYYVPHIEESFYNPFQLRKLRNLCTKILLDHGTNPNAFVLGAKPGTTVLNMSVSNNDHEMVTLLVSSKAEINPSNQDVINPLKTAVTNSPSLDTVKILIQLGADIFRLDPKIRTSFEDFALTYSRDIESSSKEGAATSIKISEYLKDAKIRIIKRSETTLLDLHIPQALVDIIIKYLWG